MDLVQFVHCRFQIWVGIWSFSSFRSIIGGTIVLDHDLRLVLW